MVGRRRVAPQQHAELVARRLGELHQRLEQCRGKPDAQHTAKQAAEQVRRQRNAQDAAHGFAAEVHVLHAEVV